MRRPALLIASLAVLGSVLTACGNDPSQANSAVIIGSKVITVDDVQNRLNHALDTEPAAKDLARNRKLDQVSRGIVDQLVRHELIAEAARREGLSVTEKDVSDALAQAAPPDDPVQKSVNAAFDMREIAKDRLLVQALGHKYLDNLAVHLDGAVVQSTTNAKDVAFDLARKIAAHPDKVTDTVRAANGQEVQPVPVQDFNPVNTYQIYSEQQVTLYQMFGAAPNTVIAFPIASGEQGSGTAWLVGLIETRSTTGKLSEQDQSAAAQVAPGWEAAVGTQLLGLVAGDLSIRISPRYGVWDEVAVGLAPSDGEKTGLLLPAASTRQ
jgi:hypothetical protein